MLRIISNRPDQFKDLHLHQGFIPRDQQDTTRQIILLM